jgi:hypothetical protein
MDFALPPDEMDHLDAHTVTGLSRFHADRGGSADKRKMHWTMRLLLTRALHCCNVRRHDKFP